MKCPKCGSEVRHISTQAMEKCSNVECDYKVDYQHQARLDRVLKEFSEVDENWLDFCINGFDINYNKYDNKEFTLEGSSIPLRLNTVESILKDLGVIKE